VSYQLSSAISHLAAAAAAAAGVISLCSQQMEPLLFLQSV